MTAAVVLAAEKITFDNSIDYFQGAVTVLMIAMGVGFTLLFYMLHHFWRL